MADARQDGGSQEKSEAPTPKRLRDARRRGDVWQSQDFSGTLMIVFFTLAAVLGGPSALAWMMNGLSDTVTQATRPQADVLAILRVQMTELGFWTIALTLPVVVLAVLCSALQVGAVAGFSRLAPDASHLNPVEGLKRIFAWRTVIEMLRLLLKLVALAVLLWLLARQLLPLLAQAPRVSTGGWLTVAGQQFRILLGLSCLIFGIVAVADLAWQRWDYLRRLRMSKEEVMREYKEREGDPILRGRRRQLHQEISFSDMLHQVRTASVVVVNPTHVAVALRYDRDQTPLPMVVAKGEGEVARAIREAAQEAGVPIYRDVSLARALQAGTPLGDYVPDELLEAVAQVLLWVEKMRLQEGGREG